MTILFLCGSLAPGHDGVGDYTRRLAGELMRQGHIAAIVALNDKKIDVLENTTQVTDGIEVPVLRLPSVLANKERYAEAKLYIDEFNPEWLSLQYVPFSFQDKGLPWGLGRQLAKFGKGRKWHVMFHELWVGMNVEASVKLKLWGEIQRLILRKTLWQLKPIAVHTQTKVYQYQLSKLGCKANYLPLFGNIPFVQGTVCVKSATDKISFVIFGSIHEGAPVEDFAKQVKAYSIANKIQVELTFVGRCGAEQANWIRAWSEQSLPYKVMGEQTPEKISEVLSASNWGITTTPLLLAEKSGTVAAMLEHGMTVICVARKWTIKNYNLSKDMRVVDYVNNLAPVLFINKNNDKNINTKINLSQITDTFVKQTQA